MVQCIATVVTTCAFLLFSVCSPAASQECSLPDGGVINTNLLSLLIAVGGEGTATTTTLLDHHFTCLAVGSSRDQYRQVSVAVRYTKSTTSGQFTAQFTLRCTSGSLATIGELDQSPPANVFNISTRRDCFICTTVNSQPGFTIDTATDCALCDSSCLMLGQGGCLTLTNCCPFYNIDGSCTTQCPTNFAGTYSSNYTCECNITCQQGYSVNSSCSGCDPVHICVTGDNPCQNGGTCEIGTSNNTDYTCSCDGNYVGQSCDTCGLACSAGYEASSNCSTCNPVHICVVDNPCQNGATCVISTISNTNYTCSCATNYGGQDCDMCVLPCPLGYGPNSACTGCVPVHICVTDNPCENGGTCNIGTNNNTDYTCSCAPNFSGTNCTMCVLPCPLGYGPNSACTGCVPVHICVTDNPCENGGTCNIGTNNNTDYTCSCAPNFSGKNCTKCVLPCPLGYEPNSACNGCVPAHICVTNNPCQNGGTCNIGSNNNTDYYCMCAQHFSGQNCAGCVLPCPLGYEPNSVCDGCIPVHICVTNNPCQNGGTCTIGTNNNTDFTCSCAQNLSGENCSVCDLPCPPGYGLDLPCSICDPVHVCLTSNPCQNGATCIIGSHNNSDYMCSCLTNYTGQNCDVCIISCPMGYEINSDCSGCNPVHFCATSDPCQNGGSCVIGTSNNVDYMCTCAHSFSGQNCSSCLLSCPLGYEPNTTCSGCNPVHICVTNNPCQNEGICNIGSSSTSYTCSCLPNYSGQTCEECVLSCPLGHEQNSACGTCVPVHICVTNNPCRNGGTCNIGNNGNPDYSCLCALPFMGRNCTLKEDPCTLNPCQNGGRCSTSYGGSRAECSCINSWRGPDCNQCGVPNCAQCSQSRKGCGTCDHGYTLQDNTGQCTTSVPTFYTPTREDGPNFLSFYWAWYALGIAIIIVATVIGIIMLVCACRKKKTEKDKQIPLEEL